METAVDLSRWREAPRGLGYRRCVIVAAAVRQLFALRVFKLLFYASWFCGLVVALLGFAFSQSLADGGWLESLARNLGPRAEAQVKLIGGLVTLYPDICVSGFYTVVFWAHSFVALWLSLLALTVLVPHLIARDRASNAMTIYLSRPLTSTDYLLGKLGTIAVVLLLVWTGPLLFGWVVSMLLSSERDFVVYSFEALTRALTFNGIALVALAPIALGASAVTRSVPGTTLLWIALWLVAGTISRSPEAPPWLKQASFSYDLSQVRQQVFRLDVTLNNAAAELPMVTEDLKQNLSRQSVRAAPTNLHGALRGLVLLVLISLAVFFRRLKPE